MLGRNFALNKLTAMGLRPDTSLNRNAINFLFLLARFFIWICRSKENIPKMESFILHLRQYKKEIEPLISSFGFQSTRDSAKTILSTECLLISLNILAWNFDLISFHSIKF